MTYNELQNVLDSACKIAIKTCESYEKNIIQLKVKINEINVVQHNQFKYINELEAENQRLKGIKLNAGKKIKKAIILIHQKDEYYKGIEILDELQKSLKALEK